MRRDRATDSWGLGSPGYHAIDAQAVEDGGSLGVSSRLGLDY